MQVEGDTAVSDPDDARAGDHRVAFFLAGGAALCLVAAGGLMWWKHGDAIFGSMVTAALAWCF
ncbi:hypothetical protein [uncultured Enterovirga sp.]|uniref:hypothetical protein n=1 Tax=uncultured Enterovirga sp. TaxID=2026352 RepID=UPI0035CB1CED